VSATSPRARPLPFSPRGVADLDVRPALSADAAVNERWGEAARTRTAALGARAPLPAKKARAAIRLFKNTHGQARWRLTRMPPRRRTSRRNGVGRDPEDHLNRSHVPNDVRCSELAPHSGSGPSPQPTNARCARGEELRANGVSRAGPALAGSTAYKRSVPRLKVD
jgi:hypothetical protein